MKLSHVWPLFLLPLSGIALATPDPLLRVVVASPAMPTNSNSNSCTIDGNGKVIVQHTVNISTSGPSLTSREVRAAKLSVAEIKAVIATAAQGTITGKATTGGYTHQYFAYQTQNSHTQKIFLLDKVGGGLINDSLAVTPLTKFMDSVCGDLSFVPYQDTAKAKFSEVVFETYGVKAAAEVCGQTNNGFGTPGSASACDGTPTGDYYMHITLDQIAQKIAATPPADATTASVTVVQLDNNHMTITATAATTNGLNGETYILNGTYYNSGFLIWSVDPVSTCKGVGIC
ncbi:hypothetical protein KFZ76_02710 [Methylovulum psychrotolerans]|uniref:hypothetical protein n=1 Tax=Methylovulum psychrotolerans TaxID=1704499 RepID=UPI001BFF5E1F|nr:hypothetical protein [Methylovulum psychrotolerans]MBT9096623.1 hypothetical protein [Methylovulum psychrotolerans]